MYQVCHTSTKLVSVLNSSCTAEIRTYSLVQQYKYMLCIIGTSQVYQVLPRDTVRYTVRYTVSSTRTPKSYFVIGYTQWPRVCTCCLCVSDRRLEQHTYQNTSPQEGRSALDNRSC